jgi:hypothetical protein
MYSTLVETNAKLAAFATEKAALPIGETTKIARIDEVIAAITVLRDKVFPGGTPTRVVVINTPTASTDVNGARLDFTWTLISGTEPAQWRYSRDGADGGWTSSWLAGSTRGAALTYLPFATLVTITLEDSDGNVTTTTAMTSADPGGGPGTGTEADEVVRNTIGMFGTLTRGTAEFEAWLGRKSPFIMVQGGSLDDYMTQVMSETLRYNIFGDGYKYVISTYGFSHTAIPPAAPQVEIDFQALYPHNCSSDDWVWNLGNEPNFQPLVDPAGWAFRWNETVNATRAAQVALFGSSPLRAGCSLANPNFSVWSLATTRDLISRLDADCIGFNHYDALSLHATPGGLPLVVDNNGETTWADPQAAWDLIVGTAFEDYAQICIDFDLDFFIAEWGLWWNTGQLPNNQGGQDNPTFITNTYNALKWMEETLSPHGLHVIAHTLFTEDAADVPHDIRNGPNATIEFLRLWGGEGGTGGGGGGGGGDPTGTIVTIDPTPTANANAVMRYLINLQDTTNVLSGEFRVVRNFTNDARWLATQPTPAIMGIDYFHWGSSGTNQYLFDSNTSNTRAIEHWNAGGLICMNSHVYNPITGASTGGQEFPSNAQVTQMLVPGTTENTALNNMLNRVIDGRAHGANTGGGGGLLQLQNAGVVVMYTPWHEWNFWWSSGQGISDANLKGLWDYTRAWVNSHGIHNVLWGYHPQDIQTGWGSPSAGAMTTKKPADYDLYMPSVYSPVSGAKLVLYDENIALGKPVLPCEWAGWQTGHDGALQMAFLNTTATSSVMPKCCGWVTWGFNAGFGILDYYDGQTYLDNARVLGRGEVAWQAFLA